MRRSKCAREGSFCWWRSAWWLALLLALAGCFGGWSALCETLPLPMPEEPPLSPQLEQPSSPEWQTLLDDSQKLVTRLLERKAQSESLQADLLTAGGKLDYSAELSLRLERLLDEASPLLGSLQTDLKGISSSLSGLRMDFGSFASSLNGYFDLVQGQLDEVRGERDAARLQASVWKIAALVGGGVAIAGLTALVVIIAWKR